jgi:hypothetical protein
MFRPIINNIEECLKNKENLSMGSSTSGKPASLGMFRIKDKLST